MYSHIAQTFPLYSSYVTLIRSSTGPNDPEKIILNNNPNYPSSNNDCLPCRLTPILLYMASAVYIHSQRASFGRIPSLLASSACIALAGHHLVKNVTGPIVEEMEKEAALTAATKEQPSTPVNNEIEKPSQPQSQQQLGDNE